MAVIQNLAPERNSSAVLRAITSVSQRARLQRVVHGFCWGALIGVTSAILCCVVDLSTNWLYTRFFGVALWMISILPAFVAAFIASRHVTPQSHASRYLDLHMHAGEQLSSSLELLQSGRPYGQHTPLEVSMLESASTLAGEVDVKSIYHIGLPRWWPALLAGVLLLLVLYNVDAHNLILTPQARASLPVVRSVGKGLVSSANTIPTDGVDKKQDDADRKIIKALGQKLEHGKMSREDALREIAKAQQSLKDVGSARNAGNSSNNGSPSTSESPAENALDQARDALAKDTSGRSVPPAPTQNGHETGQDTRSANAQGNETGARPSVGGALHGPTNTVNNSTSEHSRSNASNSPGNRSASERGGSSKKAGHNTSPSGGSSASKSSQSGTGKDGHAGPGNSAASKPSAANPANNSQSGQGNTSNGRKDRQGNSGTGNTGSGAGGTRSPHGASQPSVNRHTPQAGTKSINLNKTTDLNSKSIRQLRYMPAGKHSSTAYSSSTAGPSNISSNHGVSEDPSDVNSVAPGDRTTVEDYFRTLNERVKH